MFDQCTGLTNVPYLPATTLGEGCYYEMFQNCWSLTEVPTNLLSGATTLVPNCYSSMFHGCSSLTGAP